MGFNLSVPPLLSNKEGSLYCVLLGTVQITHAKMQVQPAVFAHANVMAGSHEILNFVHAFVTAKDMANVFPTANGTIFLSVECKLVTGRTAIGFQLNAKSAA